MRLSPARESAVRVTNSLQIMHPNFTPPPQWLQPHTPSLTTASTGSRPPWSSTTPPETGPPPQPRTPTHPPQRLRPHTPSLTTASTGSRPPWSPTTNYILWRRPRQAYLRTSAPTDLPQQRLHHPVLIRHACGLILLR